MIQPKVTLDDFEIIEKIMRGNHSRVYSVKSNEEDLDSNLFLAAKVVKSSNFQYCDFLINEYNLLNQLNHQNIVKAWCVYEEGILDFGGKTPGIQVHYLLMELCTKFSLQDLMQETGMLDENLAKYIFIQIANGISHCHSKNIFHRDLKGQNILFDQQDLKVKIIDFNFGGIGVKNKHHKYLGTPSYQAPEINQRLDYVGNEIDIFNLGVILFFMVTGFFPFKSAQTYDIDYCEIYKQNYSDFWKKQHMKKSFSIQESCKQLIYWMLQFEGKNRPSLQQIQESEWFQDQIDESNALQQLQTRAQTCIFQINSKRREKARKQRF